MGSSKEKDSVYFWNPNQTSLLGDAHCIVCKNKISPGQKALVISSQAIFMCIDCVHLLYDMTIGVK